MTDTLFPAAFPALALAHFVALLSPGPDFFLITGHAVRHRLKGSVGICVGIAAGNAVYIALAVAGWSGLRQWPGLFRIVECLGAVYLVWLGFGLLRSSRSAGDLSLRASGALSLPAQLCAGFGSAMLNPKNAVFYLTLMTVILGPDVALRQQAAVGVWMTLVVLAWDTALAGCISLPPVQRAMRRGIAVFEGAAGLVLITLAVALLLAPLAHV